MTGYYIEVGYNSHHGREEVWNKLKEIVRNICQHPETILSEDDGDIPNEYAESYRNLGTDLTIRIVEEEDEKYIVQYASGGGIERDFKERMRRAFCRLVMKQMNSLGMEVNIRVA